MCACVLHVAVFIEECDISFIIEHYVICFCKGQSDDCLPSADTCTFLLLKEGFTLVWNAIYFNPVNKYTILLYHNLY
jgi:hypothetical protein